MTNPTKRRPGRPGRPKKPVLRADLLSVARGAFAELGYSGASMNEIAGRAGIRKPSLFHHFVTKEALYIEAVGAALAPLGGLVAEAAMGTDGFWERLDLLGELVVDYLGGHPDTARLLVREVLDRGPFLNDGGQGVVRSILDGVGAFLEQGMDEGVFARGDSRHLTLSIIGVHLFYFSADPLSGAQISHSVFHPEEVESRKRAVVAHVRALVGTPGV